MRKEFILFIIIMSLFGPYTPDNVMRENMDLYAQENAYKNQEELTVEQQKIRLLDIINAKIMDPSTTDAEKVFLLQDRTSVHEFAEDRSNQGHQGSRFVDRVGEEVFLNALTTTTPLILASTPIRLYESCPATRATPCWLSTTFCNA